MKPFILILTILVQTSLSANTNNFLKNNIDGVYLASIGLVIFEFDKESATLLVKRLASESLDRYKYELDNNRILVWNKEVSFKLLIIKLTPEILVVKEEENGLKHSFYKFSFEKRGGIDVKNKILTFETEDLKDVLLTPNGKVVEFQNSKYRKDKIWKLGEENGIVYLNVGNEKFYFLNKIENGYGLGKKSSDLEIIQLTIESQENQELMLNGTWCAKYQYENKEIINNIEYKLVIKENEFATLHRNDLFHPPDKLILKIEYIPYFNIVELKLNSTEWGVFEIVESDGKIILKGLEVYIEDKNAIYTNIIDQDYTKVKFKKNCD